MAGNGPAPKPADRRARRNADQVALKVVYIEPVPQPELPTIEIEVDGALVEFTWPARTREWWAMWGRSPLSADFTDTDWSSLMDTALIHARYWRGDLKLAGELRLREAKFAATPEDRLRLRIMFAQAEQAESGQPPKGRPSSRERRGGLKSLPPPKAAGDDE